MGIQFEEAVNSFYYSSLFMAINVRALHFFNY